MAKTRLLDRRYARIFRLTHIKNIPWILKNGLHCRSSHQQDTGFVTIGNADLITKRAERAVPIPPQGCLADYIPFYFTPFSIMMYQVVTGHAGIRERSESELVFLAASARRLVSGGRKLVFTDRHAYTRTAKFFASTEELGRIDWDLLRKRDFKNAPDDPGKKERYQAEALVHKYMPITELGCIACRTASAERVLKQMNAEAGSRVRILLRPNWYFFGSRRSDDTV